MPIPSAPQLGIGATTIHSSVSPLRNSCATPPAIRYTTYLPDDASDVETVALMTTNPVRALVNAAAYLQRKYLSIHSLPETDPVVQKLRKLLAVRNIGELKSNKRVNEWFPSGNDQTRIYIRPPSTLSAINNVDLIPYYLKGQAFEQLVGVALALKFPAATPRPQYCLRIESRWAGMRIDFKVRDWFIEAKWGHHAEDIQKAIALQQGLVERNRCDSDYPKYQMIVAEKDDRVGNKATTLKEFAESHFGVLDPVLGLIKRTAEEASQNVPQSQKLEYLRLLRDYLYTVRIKLCMANISAAQRSSLCKDLLSDIEHRSHDDIMASIIRVFVPRQATFFFNGRYHYGFVAECAGKKAEILTRADLPH